LKKFSITNFLGDETLRMFVGLLGRELIKVKK